eukprot:7852849-Heterocapsa_arctica.AAC.1
MACHFPFVFDAALMGGAKRSIATPAMAARVVAAGTVVPPASTAKQKQHSAAQLAKAFVGSEAFRSASSDTNK